MDQIKPFLFFFILLRLFVNKRYYLIARQPRLMGDLHD